MDISLYMIVCIKIVVFVNDDPMLTIIEKNLSLLHKLIFGHSGFQNVNLEVFPGCTEWNLDIFSLCYGTWKCFLVYGMETWNFQVYGIKNLIFFRDILELRNMVPEISGSEKFRFTVHLEISRNSGLMETLFRDEH